MISYIIRVPYSSYTSYKITQSFNRSDGNSGTEYDISYQNYGNESGSFTFEVKENGQEVWSASRKRSGNNNRNAPNSEDTGNGQNSRNMQEGHTVSPNGVFNGSYSEVGGDTYNDHEGQKTNSGSGSYSKSYHLKASRISAPKDASGNDINGAEGPIYEQDTYTEKRYFNTFVSYTTTTSSQSVTTSITSQSKLAKAGTTTTASVESSVVTIPTTTNNVSWSENKTTFLSSTNTSIIVVTASTAFDSIYRRTAHTVVILSKGEKIAIFKSDVSYNTTNSGTNDTNFFTIYQGETTFTISRHAGTFIQQTVIDDAETDTRQIFTTQEPDSVTRNNIEYKTAPATRFVPDYPFHFPLYSETLKIVSSTSISTTTADSYKEQTKLWGQYAPTTTCLFWKYIRNTYDFNGFTFEDLLPASTVETYIPQATGVNFSAGGNWGHIGQVFGGPLALKSLKTSESGSETNSGDGWTSSGEVGGSTAWKEEGNYYLPYKNASEIRRGDFRYGLAACLEMTYAWGVPGETSVTPFQSIKINGIETSDSVTWPFVSLSAGVGTPKPFVTVSQKPETSKTSSTAANKTEITKRRIWADEFYSLTSSINSSTGTSGSTTTKIEKGGQAVTSFILEPVYYNFPIKIANDWIPKPLLLTIGGFARVDQSTIIVPADKYANTTLEKYTTFIGSSITNSYFEAFTGETYICGLIGDGDYGYPFDRFFNYYGN